VSLRSETTIGHCSPRAMNSRNTLEPQLIMVLGGELGERKAGWPIPERSHCNPPSFISARDSILYIALRGDLSSSLLSSVRDLGGSNTGIATAVSQLREPDNHRMNPTRCRTSTNNGVSPL